MVATVAGAVVGAVLGAVTKNVVAQAVKLVEKRCELWKGFPSDVDFIKREMLMIAGAEEDELSGKGDPSAVRCISMEDMRDLAHDIEDCLDRILRYADADGGLPLLHRLTAAVGSPPLAAEVKQLKERFKAAHQRKVDYNVNSNSNSSNSASAGSSSLANTDTARIVEPVGIDEPKQELLELLMEDVDDGQPEHRLSVISIVGFGGSGKSTLAKALYDFPDIVRQFPCRAWVVASEHRGNVKGFLTALLEKLRPPGDPATGDVHQLQHHITNYLNTKRYLIVFDNIEEEQWDCIKSIFPENKRSRIIVTTRIQALAEVCSNHGNNGYVYNMRTLDEKHSKELLQAVLKRHLPGLEQSSTVIVNKCDGHPLALVSLANYLLRANQFTESDCNTFWSHLGSHMAKEYAFTKLQQVLMSNYKSLPGRPVDLKTCLLHLCVFPNGHAIRRNSLMKRWIAQGYVRHSDPCEALLVADKSLEALTDRNIIRRIDRTKNAKVKTCRAHGIMHEFILHMFISARFVTSLRDPQRSNYRHLFMEGRPSTLSGWASNMNHHHNSSAHGGTGKSIDEKLRAHSLTVCGSAAETAVDFSKCELLRVLDLEECIDLTDDHTDGIHKLWHLKYLSLGGSISRLPSKIEKLQFLETLDMRKSNIERLPVEVIKLPQLAHLLGKFKLGKRNLKMSELGKFLPKESNLQTLAGFITDRNPGFPMLMVCMKKLRKAKIWCDSTGEDLLEAIMKFVQVGMDTSYGDRSLSLYLENSSGDILSSLEKSMENSYGYLSTLKLHGSLSGLTQFTTLLFGLRELCLSSTNDLKTNDLSNLSKLKYLEYLKLIKVSLRRFIIRRQNFPRLLRLCLVQSPTLPTIEKGALRNLISLQLLSEDLGGLSGIDIRRHEHLQEVALDSEMKHEAKAVWEAAAKHHPKRPRVLYFDRVDPQRTGSMVKYVAARGPAPQTECSTMQEEQKLPVLQSFSVGKLGSSMKDVNIAGPSIMASSKLSSATNNVVPCSSRAVS